MKRSGVSDSNFVDFVLRLCMGEWSDILLGVKLCHLWPVLYDVIFWGAMLDGLSSVKIFSLYLRWSDVVWVTIISIYSYTPPSPQITSSYFYYSYTWSTYSSFQNSRLFKRPCYWFNIECFPYFMENFYNWFVSKKQICGETYFLGYFVLFPIKKAIIALLTWIEKNLIHLFFTRITQLQYWRNLLFFMI